MLGIITISKVANTLLVKVWWMVHKYRWWSWLPLRMRFHVAILQLRQLFQNIVHSLFGFKHFYLFYVQILHKNMFETISINNSGILNGLILLTNPVYFCLEFFQSSFMKASNPGGCIFFECRQETASVNEYAKMILLNT